MFFEEKYLNTIETICPHILRYLTAAAIIVKRKRNVFPYLLKLLDQERYSYSDPITEFLFLLHVHFDFEEAQNKLEQCAEVINNDFFLVGFLSEFLDNARLLIFETYCRIHEEVDIDMLAQSLSMNTPDAEKWIVNLIRNAHFDAKINSQKKSVLMGIKHQHVFQEIIEQTKNLTHRHSRR
eukprot:GCRY01000950.1.p1 GENE.GCRY01000950.1~~GCRY01000950.1.p1  ORF type:complete len:181 (+),score=29.65 GCRY01000950.1:732-1274(+)